MAGTTFVSALAAWALQPEPDPTAGGAGAVGSRSAPFRFAMFDEPQGAVAAALLLMSAMPHRDGSPGIAIGIAHGHPDQVRGEADTLASHAAPGTILLTPASLEAMGNRPPDGMALLAESIVTEREPIAAFALRSAAEVVPHSMPVPATRLIGRAGERHAIRQLLGERRLLTLTGPPGSGKTRLAIDAGSSALGAFPDGAWFVPLAPIQDEGMVANAVARALDLSELGSSPMSEVVRQHLAPRALLLIMDNFEHLLGGASVVGDWLTTAPDLHVLATSREPLHLSGEWEFDVPPLRVPDDPDDPSVADAEAVQLFTERARAVDASFAPDAQTLRDVARICAHLGGLPLAVELAAARTKALPTGSILSRLERSMELLTLSARDTPQRHRSLRAAVSWSHDLLAAEEQACFRRLSAFRGGWSLDAGEAVTDAAGLGSSALDLITSLVDKSLVRRHADAANEPRYEMLAVIREYAHEQLEAAGELELTRERHAAWFLELSERVSPTLTGRDRGAGLDRLEAELDNLRTALRWAIDGRHVELGMRMAAALWRFWQVRAHISEGRAAVAELLAIDADVDPAVRARALSAAGSLAYWQNDSRACMDAYEASLGIRRELDDPRELASALYDLGHAISCVPPVKDSARGRALELEALEIYRSMGNPIGIAWIQWALGCNAYFAGERRRAEEELGSSVELFRELEDPFGMAWALTMHGLAAARLSERQLAYARFREALPIFAEVDDVSGIDSVLEHLARLAAQDGDPRRAVRLAAAAARIRGISESFIIQMASADEPRGSTPLMLDRRNLPLSQAEVDAASREGEAMSTAEAIAYALTEEAGGPAPGLRVRALGSMRVERAGQPLQRFGGDKAGSRQAQAIFAFLFDRGAAGITKDEGVELLWPELTIRRGDLAFHRTLGGLRTVLDHDREAAGSIVYEGGRYRLAQDLIDWSDVGSYEELLDRVRGLDIAARPAALEAARELYRGDLFDDCPFYGDSTFVEERRVQLRGRQEDLLLELAEGYAKQGERALAAERFRGVLTLNPTSTRAQAGMAALASVPEPGTS